MGRSQHAVEPRRVTAPGRDQGHEPPAPGGTVGDPRRPTGRIWPSEVILDAAIRTHGQTLGRGRTVVGLGRTSSHLSSIRGVDLHRIDLVFTHQNVDFAGCDSIQGNKCSQMGVPLLENDVIPFRLNLDLKVQVTSPPVEGEASTEARRLLEALRQIQNENA